MIAHDTYTFSLGMKKNTIWKKKIWKKKIWKKKIWKKKQKKQDRNERACRHFTSHWIVVAANVNRPAIVAAKPDQRVIPHIFAPKLRD